MFRYETSWGSVEVAENVFVNITNAVIKEFPEIVNIKAGLVSDFSAVFTKISDTNGINVSCEDAGVVLDVFISVYYGHRIPDITLRLQEKLRATIEFYTDISILGINVYIQSIEFQQDS